MHANRRPLPRNLRRAARSVALCGAMTLAGCAATAPAVETVLAASIADKSSDADDPALPLAERGMRLQRTLDRASSDGLDRARRDPSDAEASLLAAQRLFQAADLRLQRAVVAALAARPQPTCRQVIDADDEVPSDVRDAVLGLCTAGHEAAERALAKSPRDVRAQLYVALNLSLVAWANGPARSLFAGYGPRVAKAIERAVALDPEFDHAAPLRLQGRFLAKAPWPFGDSTLARKDLERAVASAPLRLNHLFLGDVLAAAGEWPAAAAQWEAALQASDDEATRWAGPFYAELARLRLAAFRARG